VAPERKLDRAALLGGLQQGLDDPHIRQALCAAGPDFTVPSTARERGALAGKRIERGIASLRADVAGSDQGVA
jgi:hypothetical protein